jgi:dihydrofolate reductase
MGKLRFSIAMSLDGFIAGPEQSVKNPLGIGGMHLHDWAFELAAWRKMHGLGGGEHNPSTKVVEESLANMGAVLMGRNMFGGHPGPWGDGAWKGWWRENPPFHVPVFVITHHPREPLVMQGGTTFTFVTTGIAAALEQARAVARGKDVVIGGGASVARQYLAAGLVDEVGVSLVPVLLGSGERLFEGLGGSGLKLEQVRAIEAPGVTHLRYRVVR